MFHIPTAATKWNATAVNEALQEMGVPSHVDGENVVIESARPTSSNPALSLIHRILPPRPWRLILEYCPDCFVFRVKAHCDPAFPLDEMIGRVRGVMRERGYVELYTDTTVRVVAESKMPQDAELDATLNELDRLETKSFQARDNNWARQRTGILSRIDQIILAAR